MQLEDTLRAALQQDAAELEPVGPGPETARRRAFRRKRRLQSGVVIIGAVGLVGGTIGVIQSRPTGHSTVRSQPLVQTPTPELAWRSVDGHVLPLGPFVTGPDGVSYVLSTAPGSTGNALSMTDLYSTSDGANWTDKSIGTRKIGDLTENDGVLYAVATGPGAQGSTGYQLSTSSDGGANWAPTSVPVTFTKPASTLPLQESDNVQVARGAHTTVVIASAGYTVDTSSLTAGHSNWEANTTANGIEVIDRSSCINAKIGIVSGRPAVLRVQAAAAQAKALAGGQACEGTVVATHTWSDLGITDPAALQQQVALVRADGGDWRQVVLPSSGDTLLQDVAATTNGFVLVEQDATRQGGVTLLSSTDGVAWTPLAGVPAFDSVSISGDRIIGLNNATSDVSISADGGVTWYTTNDINSLPGLAAATHASVNPATVVVEAGPLGYAALVTTAPSNTASTSYLVYSADGVTWKVTAMSSVGEPAGGYGGDPNALTVGADHISVAYQVSADGPQGPNSVTKLVTLVGTPKA